MPNTKSAKKELRKSDKRKIHNKTIKDNVKKLLKTSRKEIEKKDTNMEKTVLTTLKALDKAAQKGIIKKNACNRKKSKLHKKLNLIKK